MMKNIFITLFLVCWIQVQGQVQDSGSWHMEFLMPGISQGNITAMVSDDNYLYILNNSWAGEFGGDPGSKQFVRWDGEKYEQLGNLFKCASCGLGYLETMIMGNDDKIYLGGYFEGAYNPDGSYVPSQNLIRWNIATEEWESISNGITAHRIYALEILGDTLYVAGTEFYQVIQPNASTLEVYNIAAMNLSTGEWSDMNGGVEYEYNTDASVNALEKNDNGQIFVGGLINLYDAKSDSVRFRSVVLWDPVSGWQEPGDGLTYTPFTGGDARSSSIQSLYYDATSDRMFAGGPFGINDGSRGFAAFDGTSWTLIGGIGQDVQNPFSVKTIVRDPVENLLYVGGSFNYESDSSTIGNGIGIFDLNTDTWKTDPMMGGVLGEFAEVKAIHSFQDRLFVGGRFEQAGTGLANNLAAWDGTQWDALGKGIQSNYGLIYDVVKWNDKLIVGGSFTGFDGGPAKGLALFDPETQVWSELGGGLQNGFSSAIVYSLYLNDDNLYVGGTFNQAGDIMTSGIARYNLVTDTWQGYGSGATISFGSAKVLDIDLYQGHPVITGYFDQMNGVSATNMARYDGTSWQALGNSGSTEISAVFCDGDSVIYVGGNFSSIDGNTDCKGIGKYVDGSWKGLGQGAQGTVLDIDKDPNTGLIIIGGRFQYLYDPDGNFITPTGMGVWTGENWLPFADIEQAGAGKQREVHTIEVMEDSTIYIGGQFTGINDQSILNLALYDGCGFYSIGEGVDGNAGRGGNDHTEVNGITLIDNELFVGGGFTQAGENVSYGIASYSYTTRPERCDPQDVGLPDIVYRCIGDTEVLVAAPHFTSYLWNTGSTNDSIFVTTEDLYSVTVQNDFGQSFKDSINVIFEEPLVFNLGNDTTLVGGLSLTVPQDPYYTYLWSTGDTLSSINVYSSDNYAVDLMTRGGCKSSDDINITITALPGYSGGSGDGYASIGYNNTESFMIYMGGTGDGYVQDSYLNSYALSIYTGGSGDGYTGNTFINTEILAIYAGGRGDGYSQDIYANASAFNIYSGGPGDGYAGSSYLNPVVLSLVEEANRESDMHLFPNPVTTGSLNIEFPSHIDRGRLIFINMNGKPGYEQQILSQKTIQIQLNGILPPGLYVVLFYKEGTDRTYKSKIILHY